MKSITCPHCGHKIPAARSAHQKDFAVRRVLYAAQRETSIAKLARIYATYTGAALRSARKAIERMAAAGYLRRTASGKYKATVKIERDRG